MYKELTVYEKFVLMVRARNLKEARSIAGDNLLLQEVLTYLTYSVDFYRKKTQD